MAMAPRRYGHGSRIFAGANSGMTLLVEIKLSPGAGCFPRIIANDAEARNHENGVQIAGKAAAWPACSLSAPLIWSPL